MEDLEKIKGKIAALLAKANDTAVTEAEADAFNRKAHELMTRYNVGRAELEQDEEDINRIHLTLKVQRRPWSSAVLSGITKLYMCRWFSTKQGRSHIITVVGEEQNVRVCHAILIMVLRSIQSEARATGGGRSFMTGAGYRVYERCMEMIDQQDARVEGPKTGNALMVLTDREDDANQEYIEIKLNVKFGKQRKKPGPRVNDEDAFRKGVAHGNKQQLRRNLLK